MCLGIPSMVVTIKGSRATIDVYGALRDISLLVLDENVNIGDFVIMHAGYAIQKLHS